MKKAINTVVQYYIQVLQVIELLSKNLLCSFQLGFLITPLYLGVIETVVSVTLVEKMG